MKKYKAVLFDLDGTLADTSEGVYESVRYAAEKLGLKAADDELLKKFIGPPLQVTFSKEYGLSGERIDEAVKAFREFYGKEGVYMCAAYSGMNRLLYKLRECGLKVGTATYKREDYARELLHRRFTFKFDTVRGADADGKLTKAEISALAVKDMDADISETVLVGDSSFDAEGAAAAGMDFIAVTYGFGFKDKADADKYPNVGCCGSVEELERLFTGN